MIFKSLIILGRLLVVEMIPGFRAKVLVILIKRVLKISDSLLSSETMQFFSEIIILSEKFPFSEKYDLIVRQKFLFLSTSFRFTFEKIIFSSLS